MSVSPVIEQPKGVAEPRICWMTKSDSVDESLGLEYLTDLSELIIRQEVKLVESLSSEEVENTYRICNGAGEQVYYAQEESKDTQRQCCGSNRQFIMRIRDRLGMEIIRLKKKFVCCGGSSCFACCTVAACIGLYEIIRLKKKFVCCGGSSCFACCKCCANYIEIEAPVAIQIGYMRQEYSLCGPRFRVCDVRDRALLYVQGPCCTCQYLCCPTDIDFQVMDAEKSITVGKISKVWSGLDQELFSNADNFKVTFPPTMDVKTKALLLGVVFLIDFMFFEESHDHSRTERIV